jgi:1,4-alpha-glucan branching enzyme
MISQANCTPNTPMGANLISDLGLAGGGATFRVWAPRATAIYLNGVFDGVTMEGQSPDLLMAKDANGYWSGYVATAAEGDVYRFYVVGAGSSGYKRDPYARELANDSDAPFPICCAILRAATAYPWHDAGFRTPDYADMVIYQLHIGTYAPATPGAGSTFLDVIAKIEYLVALGVNVVQPLPATENEDQPSLGYDGSDYFSPELSYVVHDPAALAGHLTTINQLLAAKGFAPMTLQDITPGYAQLKAMVDLLHVYGIAVAFDVVYNHAGGWDGDYVTPTGTIHGDDESIYFWDRAVTSPGGVYDNNQSLYFTAQGFVGGLSFALWNADVRGYLKNNACFYLDELHGDGFRYDEISMLLQMNTANGWEFSIELTNQVRATNPRVLQNAEYWPSEYGAPAPLVVSPTTNGGLGFDTVQHDGVRDAVRSAIAQAAQGAGATVEMSGIAMTVWPTGFAQAWQTVPCVENHDIVKIGTQQRMPTLADGSNHRSWYARSRSRVATALLLTAPGIPQLFMGQEFLEDKQWSADPTDSDTLIWWGGLAAAPGGLTAVDPNMADHLRFTQDAVRLRNAQPALRGEGLNVFYTSDADRVLAYQRWVPGQGRDLVIVASLSDSTRYTYQLGFPSAGHWTEIFNSDAYDSCNANRVLVNPQVAGNNGGVDAYGPPMHGLPTSASITIPANTVLVFAKLG